jgi:hypothetical protein
LLIGKTGNRRNLPKTREMESLESFGSDGNFMPACLADQQSAIANTHSGLSLRNTR